MLREKTVTPLHHFGCATGREAVFEVCHAILDHGREVSPRGQLTKELAPVHVLVADPTDTLPTGIGRKNLQPAIAAAEALQNLAGVAQPGLMHRISKFFPKPSSRWDAGNANYGERLGTQLADVVELLRRDPESREAVASIWREGDMTNGQAPNLCTVSLQFLLRDGKLDMVVNMRSNDAWYGLCYDLFQFAQVQLAVARCVGAAPGSYHHWATSLHLYERHFEAAAALADPAGLRADRMAGLGLGLHDDWSCLKADALDLLHGRLPLDPTDEERWFHDTLAPFEPNGD